MWRAPRVAASIVRVDTYSWQKITGAACLARGKRPLLDRLTRARIELANVNAATLTDAERATFKRVVAAIDSEAERRAMTEADARPVWELLRTLAGT